ncbi:purine-binding chemotaxis protein CheW [Alkalibaculum bacchi]|uniref:Purine-binding chemotaxis protein CheW n=1 Tax=Alkalibaculum bacchi TaxID=645887 RepID=A0A366IG63_9FIRM|nr:chemotaxis protein CheW [Alkalibaculum bacchi]RBP70137.1 purine-binding chemotaxis protein CheW [Alkalibaculum bacchi]
MEQFIVFINNGQHFALDISKIERIIEFQQPKKIPEASDYLLGVIQHNGEILPIIDLTKRLYNNDSLNSDSKKVIVAAWKEKQMGFVVEDIKEISSFEPNQYEKMNRDISISKAYIRGFIKTNDDIIIVLDIDRLFTLEQEKEIREGIEYAL